MDDDFILTITIEGRAKDFDLPKVPGLSFTRSQQSSRTSISIGFGQKGGTKVETDYGILITVEKPGVYTIPSLNIQVDGQTESTLPLTFTVKTASAPTKESAANEGVDAFIERTLAKKKVYVGEQVVMTNKVYIRQSLLQPKIDQPDGDGYKISIVKGDRQYSKVIGGETYQVVEFDSIVVASQPGSLRLAPLKFEALISTKGQQQGRRRRLPFGGMFDDEFFDGMFGMGRNVRPIRVSSPEIALEVLPLPTEGQPDDFTGLVGQFDLTSSLSTEEASTGDTVTVDLKLKGLGYSEGVESLKPAFERSLKVYPDKPTQLQTPTSQGFRTEQTFKFAVVPTRAGQIKLGTVGLSYFDTASNSYKTLKKDLGTVKVTGAAIAPPPDQVTNEPSKTNVDVTGQDLLPLHSSQSLAEPSVLSFGIRVVLVLLACLPWLWALTLIMRKGLGQLNLKKRFTKTRTPFQQLKDELQKAQELVESEEAGQALQLTDKALRQYIDAHADERRRIILEKAKREVEASLYSGRKLTGEEALQIIRNAKDSVKEYEVTT